MVRHNSMKRLLAKSIPMIKRYLITVACLLLLIQILSFPADKSGKDKIIAPGEPLNPITQEKETFAQRKHFKLELRSKGKPGTKLQKPYNSPKKLYKDEQFYTEYEQLLDSGIPPISGAERSWKKAHTPKKHQPVLLSNPLDPTSHDVRWVCKTKRERTAKILELEDDDETILPTIYVVTPTYLRPEMLPELTRIGQTLLLVSKIHWIVADDSERCSPILTQFLEKLGMPFTHIASPMPNMYRKLKNGPRGVANRRAAIEWIIDQTTGPGVLYFLDDDNTVDINLFEEIRYTEKVSMFPVGLIGIYSVSSPVIGPDGLVSGFYDGWSGGRKFQVDMAGFAVNIDYLKKQKEVDMPFIAGYEEDGFLNSLNIELEDIEPKANLCSQILVWHTRTKQAPVIPSNILPEVDSNIALLNKKMMLWGMLKNSSNG